MGLFSFIGKAAKAIGGLIGGPVGGVLKGGGSLLDHKSGNVSGAKTQILGRVTQPIARAKAPAPSSFPTRPGGVPSIVPRQVFSSTPVMPGGAIATRAGVIPAASATPPMSYGGSSRSTGRSRTKKRTRSVGTTRRKSRKLKFGSPAWRAKYMKKGRKKKR